MADSHRKPVEMCLSGEEWTVWLLTSQLDYASPPWFVEPNGQSDLHQICAGHISDAAAVTCDFIAALCVQTAKTKYLFAAVIPQPVGGHNAHLSIIVYILEHHPTRGLYQLGLRGQVIHIGSGNDLSNIFVQSNIRTGV